MLWVALLTLALITSTAVVSGEVHHANEDAGKPLVRSKRDTASDKHWNVVTAEYVPYTRTYKDGDTLMFEGFIPDLVERVSKLVGFNYTIRLSQDGRYGSYSAATGTWSGMMGEIISGVSDLAAAPLTITKTREDYVDFVRPFQHLGLSILVKKPVAADDDNSEFDFNIFRPLEPAVWGLVALTTVIVALVLWAVNRFNPYDYGRRLERGLARDEEAESFRLTGAFWFVFTTLQWQGYDRSPRSLASKLLGIFWFAFVTLTLVMYTASVVNHLFWASTVRGKDPTQPPIRDLEDLVMRSDYSYGAVKRPFPFGPYLYLTEVAKGKEFEVIRDHLLSEKGQQSLVSSTAEGVAKVRSEKYAFFLDSMEAKYLVNNPPDGVCDLMTVGPPFALRTYGFVLKHNSPHIDEFHGAILDMHASGELEYLEQKWWVDQGKCWNATRIDKPVSDVSALEVQKPKRVSLTTLWGALLLMGIGIILSAIVCVAEILYFQFRGKFESSNQPRGHEFTDKESVTTT